MMEGGAYGGSKVGGSIDPVALLQRPQVILRFLCILFAIVVFGCIGSQGWYEDVEGRQQCLYNDTSGACNYGSGIAIIAFLAAIALLVGEVLFERMTSVKTRKHFVMADLGFSGFWTFLFFVSFCYLANMWSKATNTPAAVSRNPVQAAIAFTFFSIFSWGASAYLAYMRYKQGTGGEFASAYEQEQAAGGGGGGAGGAAYAGYPGAMEAAQEPVPGYQEPPFAQPPPHTGQNFQPPAY